jgi:hypothetical protein
VRCREIDELYYSGDVSTEYQVNEEYARNREPQPMQRIYSLCALVRQRQGIGKVRDSRVRSRDRLIMSALEEGWMRGSHDAKRGCRKRQRQRSTKEELAGMRRHFRYWRYPGPLPAASAAVDHGVAGRSVGL